MNDMHVLNILCLKDWYIYIYGWYIYMHDHIPKTIACLIWLIYLECLHGNLNMLKCELEMPYWEKVWNKLEMNLKWTQKNWYICMITILMPMHDILISRIVLTFPQAPFWCWQKGGEKSYVFTKAISSFRSFSIDQSKRKNKSWIEGELNEPMHTLQRLRRSIKVKWNPKLKTRFNPNRCYFAFID